MSIPFNPLPEGIEVMLVYEDGHDEDDWRGRMTSEGAVDYLVNEEGDEIHNADDLKDRGVVRINFTSYHTTDAEDITSWAQ